MEDDDNKVAISQLNETEVIPSQEKTLRKTIASKIPDDHYEIIIMVGILVGMTYYVFTKDTWLLVTFIGLKTGEVIGKSRQSRKNRTENEG